MRIIVIIIFFSFFGLAPIIGQSQFLYQTETIKSDNRPHQLFLEEYQGKIYLSDFNSSFEINQSGTLLNVCPLFNEEGSTILYHKRDSTGEVLVSLDNDLTILRLFGTKQDIDHNSWFQQYELAPLADFFKGPGFIEKEDGNFLLVDRSSVQIIDAQTGITIEKKSNLYEQPSNIIFNNGEYLLPASSGNGQTIGAIDENGNPLWEKSYEGIGRFSKLQKTEDGFIAVGASANGAFLLHLDTNLEVVWVEYLPDVVLNDVVVGSDDGFALVGSKNGEVYMAKANSLGEVEWEKTFEEGAGWKIIQTQDNGYAVGARFRNNFTYFIKTNENGQTSNEIKKHLSAAAILEANNTRSTFSANGLQFFNRNNAVFNEIQFEAPIGSSKNTIFNGGLWLGGKDLFNNVYTATERVLLSDFQPGPNADSTTFFNQVWQIYSSEIQSFLTDFSDGTIDNEIPFNVLKYPGKGNPFASDYFGNPYNIERTLAPFIDVNGDSLYNPTDGDYPAIKGDHMLWWMVSDKESHPHSSGIPMVVEITYMAYGYQSENTLLNNTIFVESTISGTTPLDFVDFYIGQRINFDIGCVGDDFVGCYPQGHFLYGYNADSEDTQNENCQLVTRDTLMAYGKNIPIQTATFLDKELTSVSHFYGGHLTQDIRFTPPDNDEENYNVLKGKWKDGTPLTEGELGYSLTNENITNFVFSGNPANAEEWSMCTINENIIDPDLIGSTGPHWLPKNGYIKLSVAHTFFEDIPHPCPDIQPIAQKLEVLRCFFNEGNVEDIFFVDLGNDTTLNSEEPLTLDAGENGESYFWSNQERSQQITISEPGTYRVTVTANNGCKISDEILVDAITNIKEELLVNTFSIYPNPTQENINISLNVKDTRGHMELQLLNIMGKEILSLPIEVSKGLEDTYSIPIESLPSGNYFLSLNQDGKSIAKKKVVIIK